jgi:undecaprenyl-diphosphatase
VAPTHLRPLLNTAMVLRVPFTINPGDYKHWSSFASDHAAVYFGLATVVWLYGGRRLRWPALIGALFCCLVRVYLCLHYPTDIAGGAALGVMCVVGTRNLRFGGFGQSLMRAEARNRPLFYAVSFYISFCFSTLFNQVRAAAHTVLNGLKHP